jgi:predicted ATPase
MQVLYFNNFRGFNSTFLPLTDINFLVGENSTGKTSVLKLIKIISSPVFWMEYNFNTESASLGYFQEIISLGTKNSHSFEVGILADVQETRSVRAIKMTFIEKEGLPYLSDFCLFTRGLSIQVVRGEDQIKYRYVKYESPQSTDQEAFFRKWIGNNGVKGKAYRILESYQGIEGDMGFRMPFFYLVQLTLLSKIKKEVGINDDLLELPFDRVIPEIIWMAPIRTEPKRTYDNYSIKFVPDGTHAPYLLKKLLNPTKGPNKANKIKAILEKFGKDSGLFNSISITPLGNTETAPFEVRIQVNTLPLKITNVGYGVSQVLPLIIEVLASKPKSWFAIQQPEIHLHPRAQAAFGDFILKSYLAEGKKCLIETHSDFTIDRFRLKVSKTAKKDPLVLPQSQVIFFKKLQDKNELVCIPIQQDGNYPEDQPTEFRNFFIREQLDLLTI